MRRLFFGFKVLFSFFVVLILGGNTVDVNAERVIGKDGYYHEKMDLSDYDGKTILVDVQGGIIKRVNNRNGDSYQAGNASRVTGNQVFILNSSKKTSNDYEFIIDSETDDYSIDVLDGTSEQTAYDFSNMSIDYGNFLSFEINTPANENSYTNVTLKEGHEYIFKSRNTSPFNLFSPDGDSVKSFESIEKRSNRDVLFSYTPSTSGVYTIFSEAVSAENKYSLNVYELIDPIDLNDSKSLFVDDNSDSKVQNHTRSGRLEYFVKVDRKNAYSMSPRLIRRSSNIVTIDNSSIRMTNTDTGAYSTDYNGDLSFDSIVESKPKTYVFSPDDKVNYHHHRWDTILGNAEIETNIKMIQSKSGDAVKEHVKELLAENRGFSLVADPVDAFTGNFVDERTLLSYSGNNPLTFDLNYDSIANDSISLGGGFVHNFETFLEETDKGIDVYWTPNRVVRFDLLNGEYTPRHEKQSNINIFKTKSGFTVIDEKHQEYLFDENGRVLRFTDKVGLKTDYHYSVDKLSLVENEKGQTFEFSYSSEGKLSSVVDRSGRKLTFSYRDGRLSSVLTPNKGSYSMMYALVPSSDNQYKLSQFNYDREVLVRNLYDKYGRVRDQFDGLNYKTTFKYDEHSDTDLSKTTITTGQREEVLVHDASGNLLQKTDSDGYVETHLYDEYRNRISTTDKNGGTFLYSYDDLNRLTQTTNPDGTSMAYAYDSQNNISKITRQDGAAITNTYEDNRLVSSLDVDGVETNYSYDTFGNITEINRSGYKTTYQYDSKSGFLTSISKNDRMVSEFENDTLGRVTKTTLPDQSFVKTEYDVDNNVVKVINQDNKAFVRTYNKFGNVLTEKDSKGQVTTHRYDSNGNQTYTKIGNRETTAKYDAFNQLTQTSQVIARKPVNQQTFTYSARGDLIRVEDSDSFSKELSYDGNGNTLTSKIGDSVTTYAYDDMDKIVSEQDAYGNETSYGYDVLGNMEFEVSPSGITLIYEYDKMGRILSLTDTLENQITFNYDVRGNLIDRTDANGAVTTYAYNDNNQVVSEINALGEHQSSVYNDLGQLEYVTNNRDQKILSYDYDVLGQISKITDGNGHERMFTYDDNGNPLTSTDANGHVLDTFSYNVHDEISKQTDVLGYETVFDYDDLGNLSQVTDAAGNTSRNHYTQMNHLNGFTDSLDMRLDYTYDVYGLIQSIGEGTEHSQSFTRDLNQNLIEEGFGTNKVKYEHNNEQQVVSETNAREDVMSYEYDMVGRVSKEIYPDDTVSYEYDSVGNQLVVDSSHSRIERTYDLLGRVLTKTQDGKTIGYQYDDSGNIEQMTYPTGETVRYTYDIMGNLLSVTDWNNHKTVYQYNENDQLINTVHANGTQEIRSYDKKGQVLTLVNKKNDDILSSYSYEYDANGNIVKENDLFLGYDALNRLTQAGDNTYTYSPFGNVTDFEISSPDGSLYKQSMTYGQINELSSIDGIQTVVDADGNLSKYTLHGVEYSASYNAKNQMVSFDGNTYQYDGENNRIALSEDNVETSFVIDTDSDSLSQVLVEESNGESNYHVYGHGLIGSYDSDGLFETNHYDYRGSVTSVTDELGHVIGSVSYDEYGVITEQDDTITTRFLYNGKYGVQTDANGLYYMRARYYSPELKRFVNRDVLLGSLSDTQTLNRYAFVNGNPISYYDPFGLARETLTNKVSSLMPMVHTTLDFAGMVPVLGMVPDGLNATLYLSKGDYTNAALSGLGMIPFLGEAATGYKYANRAIDGISFASKHADTIVDGAKLAGRYTDDVAKLGAKGYNKVRKSNSFLKMDLQTFAKKKRVSVKVDPYQRPSGFRKGVRKSVYENAKDVSGKVFDVQTNIEIKPKDNWDMGHLPGYEFKKHKKSAQSRSITRKQFLNEHNDPTHYTPELPSSNRNHMGEAPDNIDFWKDIR